ncbi:ABC transporter permease [Microvirga massiliensis]|uniref:ABC transporter permease n=1 Tax=Microvirga massiliensis TaxID=1033741 RepID=UPI00062B9B81|nr:ABC transporter permease [Microvirga massiliensis]
MTRTKALAYQFSPWIAAIGLFVVWELTCRLFRIPEFTLPAPSATLHALIAYWPGIWPNARHTLLTTLAGFLLATGFGLVLGAVVGASPLLYRALNPILIGFNSVPKVAVVPVLVIWFGIGTIPAVITAFLVAFFPIMVNVATGIVTMEPELADVLRSLGASKFDILRKVGIPRSMPYFFASLKVAITLAFVGSVVSETVASNEGIGYLMLSASSSFRVPLVFAGLLVIAAMGIAMYWAAAVVEARLTRWATHRHTEHLTYGG